MTPSVEDLIERLRAWTTSDFWGYQGCPQEISEVAEALARQQAEIERLRAGLQLFVDDTHKLFNVTARQTAESILSGKPI